MGALHILQHEASAGRSEGLDRVELPLFHASGLLLRTPHHLSSFLLHSLPSSRNNPYPSLHDGHGLPRMYLIRPDAVSIQVPAASNGVHFPVERDLVALHHFLDGLADLAELHIDATGADACIGGLLHRLQKRVEGRVKGDCPRTVYDSSCSRSRTARTKLCSKNMFYERGGMCEEPSIWVPKSIFITSPYWRMVSSPQFGV